MTKSEGSTTLLTPLFPQNVPSPSRHDFSEQSFLIIRPISKTLLPKPLVHTGNESRIHLSINVIEKIRRRVVPGIPLLPLGRLIPMRWSQIRSQSDKVRDPYRNVNTINPRESNLQ